MANLDGHFTLGPFLVVDDFDIMMLFGIEVRASRQTAVYIVYVLSK